MALVKWEPFGRDLERMRRLLERSWPMWLVERPVELGAYSPDVNVYPKGDDIIVEAELPGVKREDVDIRVEGSTLSIRGEKKPTEGVKDEDYYCCERLSGSFHRTLSLPSTVDPTKVEAELKDGILTVRLPKTEEAKPKHIPIH